MKREDNADTDCSFLLACNALHFSTYPRSTTANVGSKKETKKGRLEQSKTEQRTETLTDNTKNKDALGRSFVNPSCTYSHAKSCVDST
jgi:hypothetical protein